MVTEPIVTTPFAERIRLIKAKFGLNTAELSRRLGVSNNALRTIEIGQTKNPGVDIVIALNEKFGINYNWMLAGKGPMLEADDDKPTVSKLQAELESKNRTIQRLAERLASKNKGVSNLGRVALLELQFLTGTPVGTPSAG